ncbi:MAG: hypothetical protein ACRC2T_00345, partial [Thermoguttaceae bacterium]
MKQTIIKLGAIAIACGFLTIPQTTSAAEPNDWENPKLVGVNNLPPHSSDVTHSQINLNGSWKFKLVKKV